MPLLACSRDGTRAALLLRERLPHLRLPPSSGKGSAACALRDRPLHDSWQLLRHLVCESALCRRAVLKPHLESGTADADGACAADDGGDGADAFAGVLPMMLQMVEILCESRDEEETTTAMAGGAAAASSSTSVERAALLLPTLRSLQALLWSEPHANIPRVHAWLRPPHGQQPSRRGAAARSSVFSELLRPTMPDGVRACACELLEVVLRDGAAFAAFATPQPTTADSAIAQVALALSARLSGSSVDAPLPLQRVEPHEAQQQRQQQHKQRSSRHASSRVNENDDGAGIVSSSGRAAAVPFPHGSSSDCSGSSLFAISGSSAETLPAAAAAASATATTTTRRALRQAALSLLSSLMANHEGAADRLLDPALALALPMRLVSLLQSQVHGLLQPKRQPPSALQLDTVRACVLLLLELARGSNSMRAELQGGWSADLMGTLHLVHTSLSPHSSLSPLSDLSAAAKLLENALTRDG